MATPDDRTASMHLNVLLMQMSMQTNCRMICLDILSDTCQSSMCVDILWGFKARLIMRQKKIASWHLAHDLFAFFVRKHHISGILLVTDRAAKTSDGKPVPLYHLSMQVLNMMLFQCPMKIVISMYPYHRNILQDILYCIDILVRIVSQKENNIWNLSLQSFLYLSLHQTSMTVSNDKGVYRTDRGKRLYHPFTFLKGRTGLPRNGCTVLTCFRFTKNLIKQCL